jgi:hypothetical protein
MAATVDDLRGHHGDKQPPLWMMIIRGHGLAAVASRLEDADVAP